MQLIFTSIVLLLLIQWDRGEPFKRKKFILEVLILSAVLFVMNKGFEYLNDTIHFSVPFADKISEQVKAWIGFSLFFIFSISLSLLGWKQLKRKNSK